jgi:signal peptidase I
MFVFRSSLADWNTVPTGSMKPTILEGDRILVNKMAFDIRVPFTHVSLLKISDPARGDIVVFDSTREDMRMVKRIIGVPGDVVAMKKNVLYINGEQLAYHDISTSRQTVDKLEILAGKPHIVRVNKHGSQLSSFSPVKVPAGHYLVMGDNRDNSSDSRVFGFVPRNEIVGRSKSVVMSLNYDNYYLPRGDRFFHEL